MEPLVDIVIEDPRWQALDLPALADRAARTMLADLGMSGHGFTICLMACDDARIAALNADFRGKSQPTNVLSWPSEERGSAVQGGVPDSPEPGTPDDPEELGDIALAWETCCAEAKAAEKSVEDHVTHLVLHGMLHLLGYDHIRDKDAELMESTEQRILARLGVEDPYA